MPVLGQCTNVLTNATMLRITLCFGYLWDSNGIFCIISTAQESVIYICFCQSLVSARTYWRTPFCWESHYVSVICDLYSYANHRLQQSVHQPTRWSVQFCSVLFPFLENLKQMWLLAFWNKIRKPKRFKRLLTFDRTTQNMRIFSGPNPFWKQRIDRWTMTHEKWKLSTYHVSVVLIL